MQHRYCSRMMHMWWTSRCSVRAELALVQCHRSMGVGLACYQCCPGLGPAQHKCKTNTEPVQCQPSTSAALVPDHCTTAVTVSYRRSTSAVQRSSARAVPVSLQHRCSTGARPLKCECTAMAAAPVSYQWRTSGTPGQCQCTTGTIRVQDQCSASAVPAYDQCSTIAVPLIVVPRRTSTAPPAQHQFSVREV